MDLSRIRGHALEIIAVAAVWWLAFRLNEWLVSALTVNQYVSWLFLPAAVRVLGVLMYGGRGAWGLFLGAVAVNVGLEGETDWIDLVGVSTLSAVAPVGASWAMRRYYGIPVTLEGLTQAHLFRLVLLAAFISAVSHHVYFAWSFDQAVSIKNLAAMMVGDVLGCVIVLFGLSLLIGWFEDLMQRRRL